MKAMTYDWGIDAYDVEAYLKAIDVPREEPSRDYLTRLYRGHVSTLAFSSVNVLLGDHPGVDPATVCDQLVRNRRGGYCLEHVQLFAGILERLGFHVKRHFGRVWSIEGARTHFSAVVTIGGRRYHCDPGFGFGSFTPVPFEDGARVDQGGRVFGFRRDDAHHGMILERDGVFQHIVDDLPVAPIDVLACHEALKSGIGPFSTRLMASRYTDDGHVTITQNSRTIRAEGRATTHEEITPTEAVEATMELGIQVDPEKLAAALRRS